jgi:hypothetical protein
MVVPFDGVMMQPRASGQQLTVGKRHPQENPCADIILTDCHDILPVCQETPDRASVATRPSVPAREDERALTAFTGRGDGDKLLVR